MLIEEKFNIDAKDEEILETFQHWLRESQSFHDELKKSQQITEEYYKGNQTDRNMVPDFKSNVVENRIFEAVETIVPIATANAHKFVAIPPSDEENSVKKAFGLQKVLTKKYQTLEMQRKNEQSLRHLLLYRFGVLKYMWDELADDLGVEVIDPRLILMPKMRLDPHQLPYVIEIQDYSYNEMRDYFPKADLDELSNVAFEPQKSKSQGDTYGQRKLFRVYETWTDEMVVWIVADKILEKKANPYWDFEGDEKEVLRLMKTGKIKRSKRLVYRNHLDRPEKPYVFLTTFSVGDSSIGDVSLVESVISLQDAINVQKRQIINNLRSMGNGQVLVDTDAMSQEETDNITNEDGLIIRGEGVASQNKVRREAGVPLPAGHFTNLNHSEMVFDNIFGVHSATRGAAAAKTLGQDILSRQQDYTRVDLLTRVLNRAMYRLANGLVQLMKMFYDETHAFKILGDDGAVEFVNFNRKDVEDYVEIDVKSGEDLPMDIVSLRTEAVQMWQLGALDPVTLFERLRFPNPEKSAERLKFWKLGQLSAETEAKIATAKAGAEAKASLAMGGEEEGRGTEMPANVLQRATAGLGGTAPSLKGIPKTENATR